MFIKFLKLTNNKFFDFKRCLYDKCTPLIAFKGQTSGYRINWKKFLFEVIYYPGINNFDTLRPKWYGLLIKGKCNLYIINFVGLPIFFWLTFFAFIFFACIEQDLLGIIIGNIIFIFVHLLNFKEYSFLKKLANSIIQQYIKETIK